MKNAISILVLCFVSDIFAAGKIDYVNVSGEIVHFSTVETKSHTSPACVVAETSERYTLSLSSKSGRALYSLLMAAMVDDLPLAVESGMDCADFAGIERANGISIAPAISQNNDSQFSGTILENMMEIDDSGLISKNTSSNNTVFFDRAFYDDRGSFHRGALKNRTQIAMVSGNGWLTSILTPVLESNVGMSVTVEVILDGVSSIFVAEKKNRMSRRWFFGMTGLNEYGTGLLRPPEEVISLGKAVRFEQSLEVWVTMGVQPRSSGAMRYGGVNYILGGSRN